MTGRFDQPSGNRNEVWVSAIGALGPLGDGSRVRIPGGLLARLTLPRVTFWLLPVRGVPPDRLSEAVRSAIRFVRPADRQAVAVGAA